MAKVLTGAGAIFCAAHVDRKNRMHGHTWEVIAWWKGKPDAVQKQQQLAEYLAFFDHSILAPSVSWAEDLAAIIKSDLGCDSVDINHPLERLYVRQS